jgi:hypothetical protein
MKSLCDTPFFHVEYTSSYVDVFRRSELTSVRHPLKTPEFRRNFSENGIPESEFHFGVRESEFKKSEFPTKRTRTYT